ncbi:ATP12-domain-containing protein [Rhodofomes roseus]|uniref:ATP12-domain-containing protein n=1 Tax=Rhodofomes roseus TaxID=34475 RepID=A0ABQ8KTX1_9APHY|nr:ATP12-domain-containing protein [Rhodofomes roseus]KAH9842527.1 ATP12-domain-containing protein [Rhodofomes roseus]
MYYGCASIPRSFAATSRGYKSSFHIELARRLQTERPSMHASRLARSLAPLLASSCRRTVQHRFVRVPRRYASVATPGPAVTATNRAEATLKRFWKTVGIEEREDAFAVTLDKRPLRTPGGKHMLLPKNKRLAATLIASEWENQETLLKPHSLPMTSIASRAIDAFSEEQTRAEVRGQLLKYFETDTICFHQTQPAAILKLQSAHWWPIINWAQSTFEIGISTTDSLLLPPHPQETYEKLDKLMSGFDAWEMAAMERITYTSKSFLIALALIKRQVTAEEAALAAHVEVNSQIELWGEVEDCEWFRLS